MKAWGLLWLLIAFLGMTEDGYANIRVRHVPVKGDEIVIAKTALGVATIIQVPDKPNSVVVGDQSGFKIEYLDQAVTIKPLRAGAKSNLYIYTDWRRFNVQLITSSEAEADYVVYLEDSGGPGARSQEVGKRVTAPGMIWSTYHRRAKSDELTFEVKRLGKAPDGLLIVEFAVSSSKPASVEPEWIWLTQSKAVRPIQGLFLSAAQVKEGAPIQGILQIARSDVSESEPLSIEIRRKKNTAIVIPRVSSWK